MYINLQLMGQARVAAGCERTTVEVAAGSSVGVAVAMAAAQLGEAFQTFLFHPDGQARRSVLLVVGQRQVSWDSTEPLRDGDWITILPPIAGG